MHFILITVIGFNRAEGFNPEVKGQFGVLSCFYNEFVHHLIGIEKQIALPIRRTLPKKKLFSNPKMLILLFFLTV